MSIFKGFIKNVKSTSGKTFQISMTGKFEMGNVGILDDDDDAITKKKKGIEKFEFNGFDLYNLNGGPSFITVKINLKQSKDESSIPEAKLKIDVECANHDDFMDAIAQIEDCHDMECEINVEWADKSKGE